LASPLIDKGLRIEWILSPTSWIPDVIKEAVPETIMGIKAIARIIITIRQIQGFISPPKIKKFLFHHFFHFRSLKMPQIKMSQIISSAKS
jgi:hypothetical protein